jgi:predicted transcriptional regulator YheO
MAVVPAQALNESSAPLECMYNMENRMKIAKCLDFEFFLRFIEGVQQFLGKDCEIVIHDFRQGYDHSIVHIINGELSGRGLGDSPRGGMILHEGEDIEPYKQSRIFFYSDKKGKIFKSCTTLISDADNKIVGSLCMNLNVTDLVLGRNALQSLIQYSRPETPDTDIGARNIDDILLFYIEQVEESIGRPMSLMSKEEKIRALDYLDQKGVFKISKAGAALCEQFQISKFTLYSYLDETRSQRNSEHKEARRRSAENDSVPLQTTRL